MEILSAVYLSVALCSFATLFKALKQETNLSPEQRQCSLKVISLAAIFWPIVMPLSYLEKRSKAKQEFCQIYEIENAPVPLSPEFERKSETAKQQEAMQSFAA